MIERYRRPEMALLWSDRTRFLVWLKVEKAVLQALAKKGDLPAAAWKALSPGLQKIENLGIDPLDVAEKEKTLKHDVIAFTAVVTEMLGRHGGEKAASSARFFHFGLTSSDVVDTAFSMIIHDAGQLIQKQVDALIKVLGRMAKRYKHLPTIGRTHGMYAEPTSFGLKFLGWEAEWIRNRERWSRAVDEISYGKLSGAVGASPHWDPAFEAGVLEKLGLKREPVSTQVVPRDRHAVVLTTLAVMGGSMERIAIELRHLQRSEVGEVREGFSSGQKGSSAMPHKQNPISSENLTGCARLLRSYALAGLENIALWHERDISHSSVERVVFPDAFQLMDYALARLIQVLESLTVFEDQVQANLDHAGPRVFSGHLLLALVREGVSRDDSYRWIQSCALQGATQASREQFLVNIENHAEIKGRLSPKEIRRLLSLEQVMRGVEAVFKNTDR